MIPTNGKLRCNALYNMRKLHFTAKENPPPAAATVRGQTD
jgi:hypothetical protein